MNTAFVPGTVKRRNNKFFCNGELFLFALRQEEQPSEY